VPLGRDDLRARPWRTHGGAAKLVRQTGLRGMTNLYELIDRRAHAARERVAIETLDGDRLTYGELDERCARLAARLARLGVGRGDRVAAQIEKSVANVLLYLACLRRGAVYLPLNTAYTLDELDFFFGDAEPALIVCDPARRTAIGALSGAGAARVAALDAAGRGELVDGLDHEPPQRAIAPLEDDDLAALLYTSGTTGRAKGAMLTHRNLASNALTLADVWGFSADDVLLHALPLYHVHGLFVACNTVLLAGASLLFLPRFDAAQILEMLPRVTVMMGVPTYYTRLLAQDGLSAARCAGVRLFVSGSAPLLENTFHEFEARTGHRILERYGMTETGMNTSNPLRGERRPGTVGLPLPGVELRVADEAGRVLGTGEVGVLEVRGPNVFKGYWRMSERTAEEFRADGFFITGDLARIDADGYVSIVGRAKDLIISGGLNVYPKEIESVIDDLPGVVESAVIGVPHPDFGEAVSAVVVRAPGAALEEAAVIAAVRARLAGFKVPKRVWFAPSLPRNTMGKVQKNALRAQHQDAFAAPR
jgi:malonyl-CoA/methylmalonyl-CoA synthetase